MHPDDRADERADVGLVRLLEHVDHPPPVVTADDVIERARRASAVPRAWAAGIFLALGAAGVAYALPGSPLRAWLAHTDGQEDPRGASREAGDEPGGLMLDPAAPALLVFPDAAAGSYLRVVLTEGPYIVVRIPPGTGGFDARPSRIVLDVLAPDTFEVSVPRSAARVEVRAGDRTIFLKEGARIDAAPPRADGRYLLRLDGS